VANTDNSTIRKITPARVVSTFAGSAGSIGTADGTGSAARFNFPAGVAVDRAGTGNIYVGDTSNFTIRQITPAGVVTTLAGSPLMRGGANGTGSAARFLLPEGMAVDSGGNIYVADQDASTIRKIAPTAVVSTFAGLPGTSGYVDATGTAARFRFPRWLTVGALDNVYVGDTFNFVVRKITPNAVVSSVVTMPANGAGEMRGVAM